MAFPSVSFKPQNQVLVGGWVGGWGGVMLVNGTLDAHFERVGCNGWIQAQQFFFWKNWYIGFG